ncbi:hypothetical protein AVEN_139562-1, partial [Araneus ventricosus]
MVLQRVSTSATPSSSQVELAAVYSSPCFQDSGGCFHSMQFDWYFAEQMS